MVQYKYSIYLLRSGGVCMKHKIIGFVIALVVCLSSVMVALGAVSFFSKKQPSQPSVVLPNQPTETGIYITANSFLQNVNEVKSTTNLTITYTRTNSKGEVLEENKPYGDRVSVSYGDSVEFTITTKNGYYINSLKAGPVSAGENIESFVPLGAIQTQNMQTYNLTSSQNNKVTCSYQASSAGYTATYTINNITESQHFTATSEQHKWELIIPQSDIFRVTNVTVNGVADARTNENADIVLNGITYESVVSFSVQSTTVQIKGYENTIFKYRLVSCNWESAVYEPTINFSKTNITTIQVAKGEQQEVGYTVSNLQGFFRGNNTLQVQTEQLQTTIEIPDFNTLTNYVTFYIEIQDEQGNILQAKQQLTQGEVVIPIGQSCIISFTPNKINSNSLGGNGYYFTSLTIGRNNVNNKTYTSNPFTNGLTISWQDVTNNQDSILNYVYVNGSPAQNTPLTPSKLSVTENVFHANTSETFAASVTACGLYGSLQIFAELQQYQAFGVTGGLATYQTQRPDLHLGWKFANYTYKEDGGQAYFENNLKPQDKLSVIYKNARYSQFVLTMPVETQLALGDFQAIDPFTYQSQENISYSNGAHTYTRYALSISTVAIMFQATFPSNTFPQGVHNIANMCSMKAWGNDWSNQIQVVLTETIITGGVPLSLKASEGYSLTVYFSYAQVHGSPNPEDIIQEYTTQLTPGEEKQVPANIFLDKNMYVYIEYTPVQSNILFDASNIGSSVLQNVPEALQLYFRCQISPMVGYQAQANGYMFQGWYTEPNGQGTQIIDANGNFVMPAKENAYVATKTENGQTITYWKQSQDVTLYAHWAVQNVQFLFNGLVQVGSSGITVFLPSNANSTDNPKGFTMPYDTLLKNQVLKAGAAGYTFKNMVVLQNNQNVQLTDSEGNFLLVDGITSEYNGEIVLTPTVKEIYITAEWQVNTYTLTFSIVGIGTDKYQNEQPQLEIAYDAPLPTKVNVPTTVGYIFQGWYYGSEKIYDANGNLVASNSLLLNGNWHTDQNIELTSVWKAKEFTLNFMLNATGLKDPHTFVGKDTPYTFTYNTEYTLPEASSAGYHFTGWLIGGQIYNAGQTIVLNATTLGEEWFMQMENLAVAQWKIKTFQAPVIENLEFGSITFNKSVYEYGEQVIITFTPNAFYYVNQGIMLQGKTIATVSAWNEDLSANITFKTTTNLNNAENNNIHQSNAIVGQANNTYVKTITIDYLLSDIVLENPEGFFAQQTFQVKVYDNYRNADALRVELASYALQLAGLQYHVPSSLSVPQHYRLEFKGWVIRSSNTNYYYNFVEDQFNLTELNPNAYLTEPRDVQDVLFTLSTNAEIMAMYEIVLKQSAKFYYYDTVSGAYIPHEEQFSFDEDNCTYINFNTNTRTATYVEKVQGVATEKPMQEFTVNEETSTILYNGQTYFAYFGADENGVQRYDLVKDLTVDIPLESTTFVPDESLAWAGLIYFREEQSFENYLLLNADGTISVVNTEIQVVAPEFTNQTNVDGQLYVYQVYKKKGV